MTQQEGAIRRGLPCAALELYLEHRIVLYIADVSDKQTHSKRHFFAAVSQVAFARGMCYATWGPALLRGYNERNCTKYAQQGMENKY